MNAFGILFGAAAAAALAWLFWLFSRRRGGDELAPVGAGTASAGDGDPNRIAAGLLRELLAGTITPGEARRSWPPNVSQASAESYIAYFEEGLDGHGLRDTTMDDVVRNLARLLERTSEAPPASSSASARPASEVVERMVLSYLVFERTQIESALASGQLDLASADHEAGALTGVPRTLFDRERLENQERAVLMADTGAVPPSRLMALHWRVECVGALAWALGLLEDLPPCTERFDYAAIDAAVPKARSAVDDAATATLRPSHEIAAMRARLQSERRAAAEELEGHEGDRDRSLVHSRALERCRAIEWLVTPDAPSLEATNPHA